MKRRKDSDGQRLIRYVVMPYRIVGTNPPIVVLLCYAEELTITKFIKSANAF